MNTAKLFRVLDILLSQKENEEINKNINDLYTHASNQNSEEIKNVTTVLKESLQQSKINTFPRSDLKIAENIGATKYFGNFAYKEITGFISSGIFNLKENINNYKQERGQLVANLESLKNAFENLNFEPYSQNKSNEFGIIFPHEISNLGEVTEELEIWKEFLNYMSEHATGRRGEHKIKMTSDGCFEFFVDIGTSFALAELVTNLMNQVADFILKIQDIRLKQKQIKEGDWKNSREIINLCAKEEDDARKELLVNLTKEVDEQSRVDAGRKKETSSITKLVLKKFINSIQKGILPEVNPPQISPPVLSVEEGSEKSNNQKKSRYDKRLKKIEPFHLVNKAMAKIKPEDLKLLEPPREKTKKIIRTIKKRKKAKKTKK
jgi:hypothetical protein